jgi:hypothetical protein
MSRFWPRFWSDGVRQNQRITAPLRGFLNDFPGANWGKLPPRRHVVLRFAERFGAKTPYLCNHTRREFPALLTSAAGGIPPTAPRGLSPRLAGAHITTGARTGNARSASEGQRHHRGTSRSEARPSRMTKPSAGGQVSDNRGLGRLRSRPQRNLRRRGGVQ